eukprot:jgi/Chrpa1/4082/Chrysochromulina_OHIO_Genome00017267-RA
MLDALPSTINECYLTSAASRQPTGAIQCGEAPSLEAFFTTLAANCKAGVIKSNFALQFPCGLQLSMTLSPGRPIAAAPPTSTPADPARATTWAGRVGPPTSVRPPRDFRAPTPSNGPRKPPVLPFATVMNKGRHENMLTNIAAEGAARKTIDVRSFGHRLGGSDGPLLRNAAAGTIVAGTASRVSLDIVLTGDVTTFDSVEALQTAINRGDLGPDACALPESWLGPDDAYLILPSGQKVFTPQAAAEFYARSYPSTSGRRTDARVIAVPVGPAPDARLHRTRGATSGSAASMAHRDGRNRPSTDGRPPPTTPAKAPAAATVLPPRKLFEPPSEMDGTTALDAQADCRRCLGATELEHRQERAAGTGTLPAHVKTAGKRSGCQLSKET